MASAQDREDKVELQEHPAPPAHPCTASRPKAGSPEERLGGGRRPWVSPGTPGGSRWARSSPSHAQAEALEGAGLGIAFYKLSLSAPKGSSGD